jgi:hypothetical protein
MEYVLTERIFTICAWKNSKSNRSVLVFCWENLPREGKKINAVESSSSFQTTDQKCQHYRKPIHNIDDLNATVIKKTVYSFYRVEKWVPPVLGLWVKFIKLINYHEGKMSEKFWWNWDLKSRKQKATLQFQ